MKKEEKAVPTLRERMQMDRMGAVLKPKGLKLQDNFKPTGYVLRTAG